MLYVNRPTLKHIDGLGQDCSNSIAYALGLQQTCTKPSISTCYSLVLPMYSLLGYHGTISTLRQYQTTFQAVLGNIVLTHWGREKMDIFQTTFSNALFLMKLYKFRLRFDWNSFLRVQLTIFQHWFGVMALRRPGAKPLSGPNMIGLLTHICVTRA